MIPMEYDILKISCVIGELKSPIHESYQTAMKTSQRKRHDFGLEVVPTTYSVRRNSCMKRFL